MTLSSVTLACLTCGYDLTGAQSPRCPACGRAMIFGLGRGMLTGYGAAKMAGYAEPVPDGI